MLKYVSIAEAILNPQPINKFYHLKTLVKRWLITC
jgi:hypothetical protein